MLADGGWDLTWHLKGHQPVTRKYRRWNGRHV